MRPEIGNHFLSPFRCWRDAKLEWSSPINPRGCLRTVAIFLAAVILVSVGVVAERKPIIETLAWTYLNMHGIPADLEVDWFGAGGFSLRGTLGSSAAPDFSADRIEVRFETAGLGHSMLTIKSLRLVRPYLRVTYDEGRLSFGSLQPLFGMRITRNAGGPGPAIFIEDGTLIVATPSGPLRIIVNAKLDHSSVGQLSATLLPVTLRGGLLTADITGGDLAASERQGKLDGRATLTVNAFDLGKTRAVRGRTLEATASFGGLQWNTAENPIGFSAVQGALTIRADAVAVSEVFVARLETRMHLRDLLGTFEGSRVRARGHIDAGIDLAQLQLGDRSSVNLSAQPSSRGAQFDLQNSAMSDAVPKIRAEFYGSGTLGTDGTSAFQGSVTASASTLDQVGFNLARKIPLIGHDERTVAAAAEALRAVTLDIRDMRIATSNDRTVLTIGTPIHLAGANGASVTLSAQNHAPLFQADAGSINGAFRLELSGERLPKLDLVVPTYDWRRHTARVVLGKIETQLDLAPLRSLSLSGSGEVRLADGVAALDLTGCADVGFDALISKGRAEISGAKGKLCGVPGLPLLISRPSAWQLNGSWTDMSAQINSAQSRIADATGHIQLDGSGSTLTTGLVEVTRARMSDVLRADRFAPLSASGSMVLNGEEWRGAFTIAEIAHGRRLASVVVRHSIRTGSGEAAIDARNLAFDPSGLQPSDLSSIVAPFASHVKGHASFTGHFVWSSLGRTSEGRLTATGLDFRGPFGAVNQAELNVRFVSLAPLVAPPGQTVTIQHVDWLMPLEHVSARFSLAPNAVLIERSEASVAEGQITLDPVTVRFVPGSVTQVSVRLHDVNLGAIVAASGLADKVNIQARIDGVIPFVFGPSGVKLYDGHIAANGPGRLSIPRVAMTGTVETGGVVGAQQGAMQDFAYQALENLAFDQLDGRINSLPLGRIGLVFHIKGRHDPTLATEARVSVIELLRGHAFDKQLPLPKGTPIELTLDTSLNLDEILGVYYGWNVGTAAPSREGAGLARHD